MLDTNICIYLMKHQPPEVATRFAQCFVGEVVVSAITLAELEYGVACSGATKVHTNVPHSAPRRRRIDARRRPEIASELSAAAGALGHPVLSAASDFRN